MVERYVPPGRAARACKYWWYDAWDRLVNFALRSFGTPDVVTAPGEIAVDPHIHSMFSHCSITSPDRIVLRAAKLGLGAIAVLDHNDVSVTRELMSCVEDLKRRRLIPDGFLVIPGVEIGSAAGHIGAFFVEEPVADGLGCEETVRAIHEAGGLALAPHPYHSTGIGDAVFDAAFDAVETYCGSVFDARLVKLNSDLVSDARLEKAAKLGSSDAHYLQGIGSCYTTLRVNEPTLEAVRAAIVDRRCTPVMSRPYSRLQKLLGKVSRLK